jgi:putative Ca2+/H+ antiporter (TMEM165/GDT1 family)
MMPRVDKKLFFSTFVAIFLAEMGDKTQLATLSVASSATSSRWIVFAASALALVSTSAIAVLAGELVGKNVSPVWIKRAAGTMFLVLGSIYLYSARPGAG